jgi:HEAT repeat protein
MRKHAIFWLAQTRGLPGAQVATDLMFHDQDSDIRRHAIFAVSQSKSPTKAADIIRLGDSDAESQVRAQALKKGASEHVREQAIFALSQLPDGRSTHALIGVAEDRSLSREQRKRAVFWLAQSKSADAQAYLDGVLTRTAN